MCGLSVWDVLMSTPSTLALFTSEALYTGVDVYLTRTYTTTHHHVSHPYHITYHIALLLPVHVWWCLCTV
jgi:hypothetical protein